MSTRVRSPYVEQHRRASEEFRRLTPDEQRDRLRRAGIVGITPQVGDKVRVLGRLDVWKYGIVVGVDPQNHRVHVACNGPDGRVMFAPLHEFAGGKRVEMVERASAGREYETAARAIQLRGRQVDLANFHSERPSPAPTASPAAGAFLGLLAGIGLAAAAIALSDDTEWDESVGRYRDARGRFAR